MKTKSREREILQRQASAWQRLSFGARFVYEVSRVSGGGVPFDDATLVKLNFSDRGSCIGVLRALGGFWSYRQLRRLRTVASPRDLVMALSPVNDTGPGWMLALAGAGSGGSRTL